MKSSVLRITAMIAVLLLAGACQSSRADANQTRTAHLTAERTAFKPLDPEAIHPESEPTVVLSEEEWRERLTPEQYEVLREEGTEPAWSSELLENKQEGVYHCAACGQALFASEDKYDSRTGWPSFHSAIAPEAIGTEADHKMASPRVEVHCSRCGGHLGHVFKDGPQPTGLRYCVNGVSLDFRAADDAGEAQAADE